MTETTGSNMVGAHRSRVTERFHVRPTNFFTVLGYVTTHLDSLLFKNE
jgi:hypothetical protein